MSATNRNYPQVEEYIGGKQEELEEGLGIISEALKTADKQVTFG